MAETGAETPVREEPTTETRRKSKSRFADHPQAQPAFKPARPDLAGFRAIRANICYDCGGPLKDDKGLHCERLEDNGRVAFPAAVCRECKKAHLERTK